MSLIEILEKTISPDQSELQQAQKYLEQAAQQNIVHHDTYRMIYCCIAAKMSDSEMHQQQSSLCQKSEKNKSSETTADVCVICKTEDGSKTSKLTAKGCQGLSTSSTLRGDRLTFSPGQIVHTECRRMYCHPNQNRPITSKADDTIVLSPKTRRSTQDFNFQLNCVFCGSTANMNNLKRSLDTFPVRTLEFQDSVKSICRSRQDEWGNTVMGRLEYAQDLPAIEARYHQTCSTNFRTGRQIPLQFQSKSPSDKKYKKGRPTKTVSEDAFLEVVRYFQSNEVSQITVKDLVLKMTELCGDEAYSSTYMKKKLIEHFGSSIVISELDGKHNVVFFKTAADSILYSFHQRSEKDNTESEKSAVIKTAAKLILNDIKLTDFSNDVYPSSDDMINNEKNLQYVPDSLQSFLNTLLNQKQSDRKVASIGQAIAQLSMPRRIIAPLQLGLGVQMHHQFGSKCLIETLNSLGFSVSYPEVLRYESCAASTRGTVLETSSDQFVQYVADNVDHNTGTIDGYNTFHGMGIIATVTPKVNNKIIVPRTRAASDDLIAIGKINIHFYKKYNDLMEEMVFKKLVECSNVDHVSEGLEFLIKVARPLRMKTPGWSGLMQMIQTGNYPGVSSVVFMPMIDLNPSDMSCIYSTLHFVAKQSRENSTYPIVTFDQPLYWKALNIVANEPASSDIKSVLLRLGGFHTEMSFLGCLGRVMENSGFRESLETVYAPNTVDHMLSGKAVARATRGHFLVDDALNTLFVEKMYPHLQDVLNNDENNNCLEEIDNSQIETESNVDETTVIEDLLNKVLTKQVLPEQIYDNITLQIVRQKYEDTRESLSENRTARLWLQYMTMVDILKRFIKAERTGNWEMHLKSMQEMLPYFAAAGHNLYLKSGYVYLQQMAQLDTEHPDIYEAFCNGHHVIRRSDRYWAGLSSDLIIEQTELLKSLSDVLKNGGNSSVARMQAGLQLKNALYSKDQNIKVEHQQRWLMFPEDIRLHIKKNAVETLGTESLRPSTAAQCVANIACTELPQGLWPDLIVNLCQNVVGAGSTEMMKESSLEAMGYICQDIDPEILQTQWNEILTAIVHGMKKEEQSNNVRNAAINVLLNSLEFTKGNFDKDTERHFIMQVVCEATQSQDTRIKVAALQCLVKIMSLYYMYMETYMGPALFAIALDAMKDEVDEVRLQGIEFWSTVCDEEVELAIELSEAAKAGRPPERTSRFYAKGALQYLVPVLLVSLTKQEEFDDDDEWNPCKAAGDCLILMATCCEDDVIKHVLPFVTGNIHNQDWRYRDAAVMAFGLILEGPDVNQLKPLVEQALPMLIERLKDLSVIVKETGAWTIGQVCEILPEAVINEQFLQPLLMALVEGLDSEPRVSSNVCWAFSSLAEAAFENADTVEDGSDPQTYCLSSFFEQIVQKLIVTADRQDGNQSNLRNAAYEATTEMMKNSAKDCYPIVLKTLEIVLEKLERVLQMENVIQMSTDRSQYNDLTSLLCATLKSVFRKINAEEDAAKISDHIMNTLLRIFQSSTEKSGGVQADAILALSTLIEVLGRNFLKYMDAFKPFLFLALKNNLEHQVCIAAVGLVADLSRSLGQKVLPFCDEIMMLLVEILGNAGVHKSVKLHILEVVLTDKEGFLEAYNGMIQGLKGESETPSVGSVEPIQQTANDVQGHDIQTGVNAIKSGQNDTVLNLKDLSLQRRSAVRSEQTRVNATPATNISELPVYDMSKEPKGLCVIINNQDFHIIDKESEKLDKRSGTHIDAESLQKVFGALGFNVLREDNLTHTEMKQCLTEIAEKVVHTNYDCFVCCILTHGDLNHLYGTNGKPIPIIDLTSMFQANRCPSLTGKPKLFFLQACQGQDYMTGGKDSRDRDTEIEIDAIGDSKTDSDREIIPNEADFLIGYATWSGYVSFRCRFQGSYYIQKLCELLKKLSHKENLTDILTHVNLEVGKSNVKVKNDVFKQMPAYLSSLRKKLFFR